ncbi:hypothetical protein MLD38_024666 [Melastoma candidum]|uniref:Uncharacterized protein n=1 Tax=Melastoma candidum TaxID=119954 RepID=A0ACB9NTC1_9MYRT|nr:hypothetical protein MLD38_024666 [Melastoma candidum]
MRMASNPPTLSLCFWVAVSLKERTRHFPLRTTLPALYPFLISLFRSSPCPQVRNFDPDLGKIRSPGEGGESDTMWWWSSLSVDVYRKVSPLNLYCRVIL